MSLISASLLYRIYTKEYAKARFFPKPYSKSGMKNIPHLLSRSADYIFGHQEGNEEARDFEAFLALR